MNLRNKLAFFIALNSYVELITRGTSPLSLPDAIANSLSYVKAFGGTEQRNLPDGYTQLEYLQSSGSQYIDTGRVPNNNDIIEQKFQKVGSSDTTCAWYGSMPSSQIITPRIGIGTYSSQGVSSMFAGSNYTGNIGVADTNVHTLRFQATGQTKLTYTLDGVTDVIYAPTSETSDMYEPAIELTSYLFARHGTNGVQVYDNEGTKIYYHREYIADGTLMLDMVPVKRNSDNVLGMYDLVSGQFFTNQGTGDFVAGTTAVPTPDAPMDIVSNNGVLKYGVLGKNLFNVSANPLEQGGIASSDGQNAATSYDQRARTNGYIPVKPSTVYTASVKDLQIYYLEYTQDKTYTDRHASGFSDNSVTFTTGANTYFIRLQFRKSDNSNILPSEVTNVQLEQGSTATEYEPYREGIYTDGTVETIGMIAGNIISDDIANANVNSAGKVVSSAKVLHIAPVVPGETYTCDSVGTIAYFTDIPVIGSVSYDGSRVNTTNPTFTVPNDPTIKYVAFSNDTATSYCVQGSVLYNGGTATAEILLKLGDYQDVQSIIDGVVTRNVGVKVLDGTEDWVTTASTNQYIVYSLPMTNYGSISDWSTRTGDCTHFNNYIGTVQPTYNDAPLYSYWQNKPGTYLRFKTDVNYPTVESFKQFLADQYNAGTPVIVLYPLATPTTESVAGQTLQVTDGDNTLEITQASLNGLELEAKYKKRK